MEAQSMTQSQPATIGRDGTTDREQLIRQRLARARIRRLHMPSGPLPAADDGPVALAANQARLWFIDQLSPGSPEYNIPVAIRLTGDVDGTALRAALDWLVMRHEALRTTMWADADGSPVQTVTEPVPADFAELAASDQSLSTLLREEAEKSFELAQGPPFRARLIHLGDTDKVLLLVVHHAVCDGWSLDLIYRDLARAYAAYAEVGTDSRAAPPGLPRAPATPRFRDYAAWQVEHLREVASGQEFAYWRERLVGVPALKVPADMPRQARRDWQAVSARRVLASHTAAAVRRLATAADTSDFVVLLTAYAALLHRLTEQTDFAIAVPVACRTRSDVESIVGCFVNTLPIRMDVSGDATFRELLARVAPRVTEDLSHQDTPFDRLVEAAGAEGSTGDSPLARVMFGIDRATVPFSLGQARATPLPDPVSIAKCDLDLGFREEGKTYALNLSAAADTFLQSTAYRLVDQLVRLLDAVADDPDRSLSEVDLFGAVQRRRILREWNGTACALPAESFQEMFQAQAERTPRAVVAVHGDTALTYRDLNTRANRFARLLAAHGAGPERLVAVALPRSLDLLVAVLGTLKSGAAYMPVDPGLPATRIGSMLKDAMPAVLVTDTRTSERLPDGAFRRILVDHADISQYTPDDPPPVARGHAAYVIYTSGSTSDPQGVVVSRHGLDNLLHAMLQVVPLGPGDRVLATAATGLDVAAFELFLPMLTGASVVLADADAVRDPSVLRGTLVRHGITTMVATPSLWRALTAEDTDSLAGVHVLVGGEALPGPLAHRLLALARSVTTLYGRAEATIWSTAGALDAVGAKHGSIGTPVANTQVYVLDRRLRPVPPGIAGELYIAGDGLARGYLGPARLTAERFLPNPYGPPGGRMYRTGDLVRWSDSGELEYRGLADRQMELPPPGGTAPPGSGREGEAIASRPPQSALEEALSQIFARVLGRERVGADDSFFALGGQSLLAPRVVADIRRALGIELPLSALFAAPTVAGLARTIDGTQDADGRPASAPRPVARIGPLPLSLAQEGLWLASQMCETEAEYNVPFALRLIGPLDHAALRRALDRLVERHENLRTRIIVADDGTPRQSIDPTGCGITLAERTAGPGFRLEQAVAAEAAHAFDLAREHPLHCVLWRVGDREHVLLLVAHHVAVDDRSVDLLREEIAECYSAACGGREPALAALPLQYADYAVWQRSQLDQGANETQLAWWHTRLDGATATELTGDRPRPAVRSGSGGEAAFRLSERTTRELRRLGRAHGTTLSTTVLAGLQALLYRMTGDEDVVLGTTVAGRGHTQMERVVGYFGNTLVLRTDLSGAPTFGELLDRARVVTLDAYARQELPFERLVADLNPARDQSRTPLFQILYNFHSGQRDSAVDLLGLRVEDIPVALETTKFDLVVNVTDNGDRVEGIIEYARDLYRPETAERLARSLELVLTSATEAPETAVDSLPVIPPQDAVLMAQWGRSIQPLRRPGTVHGLIEAQVDRTPNRVAVRGGEEELTFAELDERSNQLANALLDGDLGIPPLAPETPVALLLDRDPSLLIAILAVLKAGGYFVPLDPEYPRARLATMLRITQPALILARSGPLERMAKGDWNVQVPVVRVDDDRRRAGSSRRPDLHVDSRRLVYAMFTSGSTGAPKGVAIEHAGAARYLSWAAAEYPGGDRGTLVHSSVGFDLTMASLLEPLVSGRGLTLLPPEAGLPEFADALTGDTAYDYVRLTPSHLRHLVAHASSTGRAPTARGWVVGGEALEPWLVEELLRLRPDANVINHYGPTETVIGRAAHSVRSVGLDTDMPLPLGRPFGDTRLHVLDARLCQVQIGAVGELHIGGEGIARGYLGSPGLTAERFLPDPYGQTGSRMYRTGDLVRWNADGRLEFIGRADDQVKLRGFRIELGEIESRLTAHTSVGEALVVVRNEHLVAYLTPAPGEQLANVSLLRRFCSEELPGFMVPARWVTLEAFPLNAHGKVDRTRLPEPAAERPALEQRYQAPRTPAERLIADLWSEVLSVPSVGIDDNFFDLGGCSIDVIRLSRVCAKAGLIVDAKAVFEHPTVRAQALNADRNMTDDPLDAVFGAGHTGRFRTAVALRTEGTGPPLFCVHPSGGSVGWYVPLSRALPEEHPVHAFQPLGMDGVTPPSETIEEMAAAYVAEMREIQSHGPYAVLGWSLGGTIAYEMARQLATEGQRTRLVLLEPTLPGVSRTIEEHRPSVRSYLAGADIVDRMNGLPDGDPRRERLLSELVTLLETAGYRPEEISLGDALPMRACGQMLAAFAAYHPPPLRSGLDALVMTRFVVTPECTDASPEHPSGTSHFAYGPYRDGWRELLAGLGSGISIAVMPGRHASMLAAQNLSYVVEHCTAILRDAVPARHLNGADHLDRRSRHV